MPVDLPFAVGDKIYRSTPAAVMCQERCALLKAYRAATQAYFHAARNLQGKADRAERTAFRKAQRVAQDARSLAKNARAKLENHIRRHGCRLENIKSRSSVARGAPISGSAGARIHATSMCRQRSRRMSP